MTRMNWDMLNRRTRTLRAERDAERFEEDRGGLSDAGLMMKAEDIGRRLKEVSERGVRGLSEDEAYAVLAEFHDAALFLRRYDKDERYRSQSEGCFALLEELIFRLTGRRVDP